MVDRPYSKLTRLCEVAASRGGGLKTFAAVARAIGLTDPARDFRGAVLAGVDFGKEDLPLGRDWLQGREKPAEWSHVSRRLIDEDFGRESLIPLDESGAAPLRQI